MGNIERIIKELEQNKEAIESALAALRTSRDTAIARQGQKTGRSARAGSGQAPRKQRHISEEGRQRIAEAQRQRWAAKKAAARKEARKQAAGKKAAANNATGRNAAASKKSVTKKSAAPKRGARKSAAKTAGPAEG